MHIHRLRRHEEFRRPIPDGLDVRRVQVHILDQPAAHRVRAVLAQLQVVRGIAEGIEP